MKVLSTEGLTKLIDLIKSSFISNEDTQATVAVDAVETTAVDAVETNVATLATVATTGAYSDLSGTPTIPTVDQIYDGTSANAQSGVAVASAIAGRADTTLSNISNTSTTSIDGQWVSANTTIVDGQSLNGTTNLTYTLSSIPNDGQKYEALIDFRGATDSTIHHAVKLEISSSIQVMTNCAWIVNRTSNLERMAGNFIIPVSNDRKIIVERASDYHGTVTLRLVSYRRIGTNT